ALYRSGRQAEALDAYRRVRFSLAEELGIEPGEELQRLHQDILTRHPRLDLGCPESRPAAEPDRVEIVTAPRQLPADTGDFVGRTRELAELRDVLLADGTDTQAAAAPRVAAISGQAGVGKTSLAVRVAHEVSAAFGDGQLFADLGGFRDPDEGAHEVMARFLRALGVAGQTIPESPGERGEMYRSRLAGARVLIVLDNAATERQVRKLSPGSGSCVVLVTSRLRLTGLAGARQFDIGVLDEATSVAFLARV
ncbi:BTAD domain-containing putative transcriptional regulator, partial [Streptomyces sp. 2MCAF27]